MGENGYLIDPAAPANLVEKIRAFIIHPILIVEMEKEAKILMSNYTPGTSLKVFFEAISPVERSIVFGNLFSIVILPRIF
jgi:hypothetical protein